MGKRVWEKRLGLRGRISGLIHQALFFYFMDILSVRKKKLLGHILYVQWKDIFQAHICLPFTLWKKKALFPYGTEYNFSSVEPLNEWYTAETSLWTRHTFEKKFFKMWSQVFIFFNVWVLVNISEANSIGVIS